MPAGPLELAPGISSSSSFTASPSRPAVCLYTSQNPDLVSSCNALEASISATAIPPVTMGGGASSTPAAAAPAGAASVTSTSSASPSSTSSSGLSTGVKIGIGVGVSLGVLGLLALALGVWLMFRARKKEKSSGQNVHEWYGRQQLDGRQIHELPAEERPQEMEATSIAKKAD